MPPALRRAVPALVGGLAVVLVGAIALRIGAANLQAAESDRLAARRSVVAELGTKLQATQSGEELDPVIDLAGFTPDDRAHNEAALARFRLEAVADSPDLALLVAPDGRTLAASTSGATVDVADLGPAWADAVAGRRGVSDAFRHEGDVANAALVPVGGERPWAVLVSVRRTATSMDQEFLIRFAGADGGTGGLTVLDRRGTVVQSWVPETIGTTPPLAVDPAPLPPGEPVVGTSTGRDGAPTTVVAMALGNGYRVVFEEADADLYGDLRDDQRRRDVTLLAVLAGAVGALVTFQLARERAARRDESRRRMLLEHSQDLVVVVDRAGTLTFVTPAVQALLGYEPDGWVGRPLVDLCHPGDRGALRSLLAEPGSGPRRDVRLRTATGDHRWFDLEATDHTGHREVDGILVTGHDVGPRRALQEELHRRATHDSLTGLANRAALYDRLHDQVAGGRPVAPFAVLYVDLDRFKPVNDTLGHRAGDHVLRVVAERFRAAAGPDGLVARLGGDEFAVVLPATEADARAAAERLREAARQPIPVAGTEVAVDASTGIALAHPGTPVDNPELLVRRADHAMYRAKQAGRGRVVVADGAPAAGAVPAGAAGTPAGPSGTNGTGGAPAGAHPAGMSAGTSAGDPAAADRPVSDHPVSDHPVSDHLVSDRPVRDDHRAGSAGAAGAALPPATTRRRRHRITALLPVVLAAGLVVAIAGIGHLQTVAARRSAEELRLRHRLQSTVEGGALYSGKFDIDRIIAIVSGLPWRLDGSPLDERILAAVAASSSIHDTDGVAAVLATPDGRVLAATSPAAAALPLNPDGEAWRTAAAGRPSGDAVVQRDGETRSQLLFPVLREERAVAVVLVDMRSVDTLAQRLIEHLGSLGLTDGGWSLVDASGTAYASWSRDLVGQHLVDAADLDGLGPGDGRVVTTPDGNVVAATLMTGASSGAERSYLAFVQPAESFFRDLRLGRGERDASLLAVVIVAATGLAAVNHWRERAIRRSELRLDALLRHAHDIVVQLDRRGTATFVSSAAAALLGHDPTRLTGRTLLDLVHPDDRTRLTRAVAGARPGAGGRRAESVSLADVRLAHRDGGYRWFDVDVVALADHPDGRGVLLTCHETSERKAAEDELAHQASHDLLTGLPNRVVFAEHLERLGADEHPEPFAVLFIDLDHFKPVNDALGHAAGDEVLRVVADRLLTCVRDGGDGRRGDVVCRLGGDEFAVLLPAVTEELARRTAERLLAGVRRPIAVAGTTIEISATIGVAVSHPGHEHPDRAVRHADSAMYRAKVAGRGHYELCVSVPDRSVGRT